MPPSATPAGWHPDPGGTGALRWWDGVQWTAHVQYPVAMSSGGWSPVTAAGGGVVDEERSAAAAKTGLVVGLIGYSVSILASAVQVSLMMRDLADALTTPGTADEPFGAGSSLGGGFGLSIVAGLVSQLASLAALVGGVLFLIWFHKAATTARSLGIPARREPVWAVVGFLIPVVNLWFPYESARDLFPAQSPERAQVGRWWGLYLGASFSGLAVVIGALVAPVVAVVAALGTVVLWVLAYRAARKLIDASLQVHHAVARGELGPMSAWGVPMGAP